jgi:hypothetical protein
MNECKVYCTGVKVNGMRIEVLRITDDIAIIAQDSTRQLHINEKNGLQQFQMESCQQIERIKDKKILYLEFYVN